MRDSFLLIAAACVAFGLSLGGVFHFDDYALFNDASITSPLATRPLTNFTFWVNEQLGGRNPIGYHALNVALHVATVLLLHAALRRILPADAALAAALLFAVHPVQTETVNYVFARGSLLATLCCAGSLLSWLNQRRWIAVIWFAAALLAKEECIAFPFLLLLLELSRWRHRTMFAPVGAMLLLAAAAGVRVLAASASIQHSGAGANAHFSAVEYLSLQGLVILGYLRGVLLPWGFTIDPQIPQPAWWLRLAAWLLMAALAAAALRRFTGVRAGLWFVGGLLLLLPSSSIFPANDLAADRRMYLPMLGFCPALACLLMKLDRKVMAALLIVLAGISVRYTYIWNSEQRLWTEAAARAPGKVRPLIQLARASDSPHDALVVLAQAENKAPTDADVASEQGRMYLTLGKPADALTAFGRALALAPGDPAALNNRGVALLALGQIEAARQDFARALAGNPCLFDPRLNLKRLGAAPPPAARCRYTAEQQRALLP